MLISGMVLVVIIGFLAVSNISLHFSWSEKIGISFPVGIGLQTIIMLIINMLGVRLTATSVLIGGLALIVTLSAPLYLKRKETIEFYKKSFHGRISGYNLVWLLFIILIGYFEFMNFSKCIYFPTFDRDSLAGFDTIGYAIAREHTFKGLSLFQPDYIPGIHGAGSYISYTPMIQLSYAYVYILGAETSKLIPALMYLFFLIAFYGSMKRVVSRTGAAIATFFMMITPEMIAFSSLSATNVIHSISASLGVIYVVLFLKYSERKDLYIGALFLGLNIWTRTDGIVFILAALFVLFIDALKTKRWKNLLPVVLSFIPALLWIGFSRINNFYSESIAILHPYWDAEKVGTILKMMKSHTVNTQFYGLTFIFFLISFFLNSWNLKKKRDNLAMLAMIFVSLILYMVVLYQIDYKWDSIQNVLAYSAKRFLFCFVPLLWFYAVSNDWCLQLFDKMESYLKINGVRPKYGSLKKRA